VEKYRKEGITFNRVGFGMGSNDEEIMQKLADKGDGNYSFVDSQAEARQVLAERMSASMQPIAQDAKIQVEFDPRVVRRFRLIGYEKRHLEDQDFRNDAVVAGAIGSGQSSTALYEVELQTGANNAVAGTPSPVGHPRMAADILSRGERDSQPAALGMVRVRYRDLETGKVREIERPIEATQVARLTPADSPRFFLAASAARFAEILRQSEHAQGGKFEDVSAVLNQVRVQLPLDQRLAELADLVRRAQGLPRAE
jgi:Ca-activated chloride channel homolog